MDYKKKLCIIFKKLFSISKIDNHFVIFFLGIKFQIKLKSPDIVINDCDLGLNKEKRTPKIIASLTSFPKRINIVDKTIKTLLNQTIRPDEIILWLAESQFPNKEKDLPDNLLKLKDFGLKIEYCEDIKSYKKLIPSLLKYPNDIIITFDDDIYYPNNVIELLYNSYLKEPNCIHSNRSRRLYFENNQIKAKARCESYWLKYEKSSFKNTLVGCGGVLYPPDSLSENVFNKDEYTSLLPTQDDAWFWAMALLKGTKIKAVALFDIELTTIENSQKCGLSKINSKQGKGIDSFSAICLISQKYPEIIDRIKENDE